MGQKQVESNCIIYNEGDVPDLAYVIVSGRVEIFETVDGKENQIRIVEPGLCFGEYALFDSQKLRPFSARAIENTVLNSMNNDEFNTLLSQCPDAIKPYLAVAFEKMTLAKVKEKATVNPVLEMDVKGLTIEADSDILKSQFQPIHVPPELLPFRIGGYPEGGEKSRRDQLHLCIASHSNPLLVSRQHCEIVIENKGIYITDLGSRFCTTVNGRTIGRGRGLYNAPLQKGVNNIVLGAVDGPYKIKVTCE